MGTPRRCGRSTPPTGSAPGAWVAPAGQTRPELGVGCLPQVRPRLHRCWLAGGLAVLLGAAVDQLTARLAQPLTRKRWTRAVAQQTLQASAVLRSNTHAGVYRETAVLVAQNLFGLKTLEQTASNKGTQDASAQCGLHLVHGSRIHAGGRVEDHTRPADLIIGLITGFQMRNG